MSLSDRISLLQTQISATENQLLSLRTQLSQLESLAETRHQLEQAYQGGFPAEWIGETLLAISGDPGCHEEIAQTIRQDSGVPGKEFVQADVGGRWPLSGEEYKRYGRQMIMSEVGLHGQLRLKNAKVLIVGCGGLGCPAAAYLAGAGVGTLGLVDGDVVEVSNLHRQIAHTTTRVGRSKVDSVWEYCRELNPLVKYERHPAHLSPSTALAIFSQYDLVLDCTDHPTSRYLISDACLLAGKPLVSASALKTEGQLIVLNNPSRPAGDITGGPCYRCIFPKPPPADSVLSCGEGGILGPVVGVMGVLQALEAVKLITAAPTTEHVESPKANMLIFSAYSTPQFRSVRMRGRYATCAACSAHATITPAQLNDGSLDYAVFCGLTHPINTLPPESRVAASDFARLPRDGSNILIDVRDETQYAMCALRGSINVPWRGSKEKWMADAIARGAVSADGSETFVVCRYGNDSQFAAQALQEAGSTSQNGPSGTQVRVKDIRGGFQAWRNEVDAEWPDY